MIATALLHAGADPSFAIGGTVFSADGPLGGGRDGAGPAFVAEADESDGSFLAYAPLVAVVTNVEPDHLDHYGSTEAFEDVFVAVRRAHPVRRHARRLRRRRRCGAARRPGARRARGARRRRRHLRHVAGRRRRRGRAARRRRALGVRRSRAGDVTTTVRLAVPGRAQRAERRGRLGRRPAPRRARRRGRSRGVPRHRARFEDRGTVGGVRVVDDYSHHPTEVAALLRGAPLGRRRRPRRSSLFQPHLYSRTRTFAAEFGAAFDLADVVVVTDVYGAREDPDPSVTGALIVDSVPTPGKASFVPGPVRGRPCRRRRGTPRRPRADGRRRRRDPAGRGGARRARRRRATGRMSPSRPAGPPQTRRRRRPAPAAAAATAGRATPPSARRRRRPARQARHRPDGRPCRTDEPDALRPRRDDLQRRRRAPVRRPGRAAGRVHQLGRAVRRARPRPSQPRAAPDPAGRGLDGRGRRARVAAVRLAGARPGPGAGRTSRAPGPWSRSTRCWPSSARTPRTPLPRLDTVRLRDEVLDVPGRPRGAGHARVAAGPRRDARRAGARRRGPERRTATPGAGQAGFALLDQDGVQVGRVDAAPEGLPVVDVPVGDKRTLSAPC